MKILIYKGIKFDDFQLYRETNNSSECEYGYPSDKNLILNEWEEIAVYICPHCIKKYDLYNEADTYKEVVDKYINGEYDDEHCSMICGVKGCNNGNSFDSCFGVKNCILEECD